MVFARQRPQRASLLLNRCLWWIQIGESSLSNVWEHFRGTGPRGTVRAWCIMYQIYMLTKPPSSHPHRAQVLRLRGHLQDPLRLAGGAAAGLLPQQGQRPGHRHSSHRAGEDRPGVRTFPGREQVNGTTTIRYFDLILMWPYAVFLS